MNILVGTVAVLGIVIGIFALVFIGALIMAWPLMWCWNYVIPAMFGLATLTYWKAFCLYVVAGLLIKSSSVNSTTK